MLARKVISSGLSQTELTVEVYPLRLQLLMMPKGDCSTIRISKKVWIEARSCITTTFFSYYSLMYSKVFMVIC